MTRRRPAAAPISRRRFTALGIGASLAAAAGIVARVGYVNATAVPVPQVIRYPMGEWVELDGAFISTSSLEQTEGYALRVTDAQVISPRSYIERYTWFRRRSTRQPLSKAISRESTPPRSYA